MSAPAADLDAREAALEARLALWQSRALELVARKLEDAEAHATKALTDTLKRTPDGRPTIRHASRSPSYQAAAARLDELLALLAGPAKNSLEGLCRDAVEDLYRAAYDAWKPFIPSALWGADAPPQAQLSGARKLVVHGSDIRAELAGPIAAARARLLAVLAQAGQRSTEERVATDLIATWRRQTEAGLGMLVRRTLSDWQKAVDTLAGRDLVHPDWLESGPPTA